MPKRTDLRKILVIGSGPIVIGQGAEFDYSGTQAAKALREEGFEVVLVNSNPATIMTDPEFADRTYIEPVTPEYVDFVMHSRPFFVTAVTNFTNYRMRTRMQTIVKRIPIADARWIGSQLGKLSTRQIQDAFRTSGFSPADVDGYTKVVMNRIAELNRL